MKMTYLIPIIFFFSCANVAPLSGGDVDKAPPQLISTFPENNNTLFNEDKIIMVFDETIQINQTEKLFFAPSISKNVELNTKGNELLISFKEDLDENTTYTIILNDIVKDVTEGNVLPYLEYAFSTGPEIDTLYIQGKVFDALSKSPIEKICVGLYSDDTSYDSILYKQEPEYLAISNNDGNFKFSNLPDKLFVIYALEDIDNNNIFSLPHEKVGFVSNTIKPNANDLTVFLFDETAINDSVKNTSSIEGDSFGRLIIDSLPNTPLIVELIYKESIVFRTTDSESLVIDSLSPGAYSLRIILDDNNNAEWDSGNLLQKQQAETVEYYAKEITIRSDWDVIVEWNTNE